MKSKRKEKREHVIHQNRHALLIIDMLNTLDFEGAGKLLPKAKKAAKAIQKLKARAKAKKNSSDLRQRQFRTMAIGLVKSICHLPERRLTWPGPCPYAKTR
jgi:hypothetical protein